MCGINGLLNFDASSLGDEIKGMNQNLHHRGPDSNGVFIDGNCALGHTRLSIIDLSDAANQPFYSQNKELSMVYNGEIYNFEEIKEKYELQTLTNSDTEVLLAAYEKIGTSIFSELNGMFAVAIYNRNTKELILAKDKIGKKPLFYFLKDSRLAFSSELNALKRVKDIKKELSLNSQAISSFLQLGYIPHPLSIYKEIKKFPAGHYGSFQEGKLILKSYWNLEEKVAPDTITNEKNAIDQLDDLINSSVKQRLKSDVPFGTFLSGGIDSSLITAVAQKNYGEKIKSFSIGFKENTHNEAEYAHNIAKSIGTNHHEFILDQSEAIQLIPQMLSAYGEPYADSSAIPTMLVSQMARKEVKMVLSGDGGDELFMGYGFYQWAKRLSNPAVNRLRKPIYKALQMGNERMQRASSLFNYPQDEFRSHLFSQEQYYFSHQEILDLLGDQFKPLPPELNKPYSLNRSLTIQEEQSLFDLQFYLPDELMVKVDIASMQNSLEVRVPLLDYRIIEFALNLDQSLKIKNGTSKYLLKELLYRYLPQTLFDRPKQGFSIPLGKWLKSDLKYLADDFLNQKIVEKHQVVSWNKTKELLEKFNKGTDYLYNRVWALIVLHYWLENNEQ